MHYIIIIMINYFACICPFYIIFIFYRFTPLHDEIVILTLSILLSTVKTLAIYTR